MRAFVVPKGSSRIDELRRVERAEPTPDPGQVVVRIRAVSLNYRDQAVAAGQYFGGVTTRDLIPMSGGAGDVIAVGAGVSRVKVGDRVATTFFQRANPSPLALPAALGSPLDGVLVEQIALFEDGVVPLP